VLLALIAAVAGESEDARPMLLRFLDRVASRLQKREQLVAVRSDRAHRRTMNQAVTRARSSARKSSAVIETPIFIASQLLRTEDPVLLATLANPLIRLGEDAILHERCGSTFGPGQAHARSLSLRQSGA